MWSNSEYVNFVSLKVVFAEPKNKFKILSSISYSHYKPKKKKKRLKAFRNLDNKFALEIY